MKVFSTLILICGSFCLGGCLSIDSAVSKTTGDELVFARQFGCTLFNRIPIGPAISMDKVQGEMFAYAQKRGKTVDDLYYHVDDSVFLDIPLLPITIPYLFCTHNLQLSGVMK